MAERAVYPRSTCAVPGCKRTSRRFQDEWLCGDHWRLVDRTLKAFRTKLLKRRRLAYARVAGGVEDAGVIGLAHRKSVAYWRAENTIWRRMKRQAIERAAGI